MRPVSMSEWLSGKDILITGATGFMGIVLVEKLLRCYPELSRLYLLVRERKGHDPVDRMKRFTRNEAFGPLLDKYPNAFDKITVIPGDVRESGCGISKEDKQVLEENVEIVFHVAASTRFNDSLATVIKMNVRSTHEMIEMAKQFKKLEVFEYVSSAFSNFYMRQEVGEKLYPYDLDWRDLVELADREEDCLNALQHKIQGSHPNTYVLSKSIAEKIVADYNSDEVPAVIVRPSIVTPAHSYPLPGWTNNLNGPPGLFAGISKGFLRTVPCDIDLKLTTVPVDCAVDGFLVAAWSRRFLGESQLQVFNQTYDYDVNNQMLWDVSTRMNVEDPFEISMWYPMCIMVKNFALFKILFFFLQIVPALVFDVLLKLSGRESAVLKTTLRLYTALSSLFDFMTTEYNLSCSKLKETYDRLNPADQEEFLLTIKMIGIDSSDYIRRCVKGIRKYVFQEKEENLADRKTISNRMFYLHTLTKFGLMSLAAFQTAKYGLVLFTL